MELAIAPERDVETDWARALWYHVNSEGGRIVVAASDVAKAPVFADVHFHREDDGSYVITSGERSL